jgi:hypothetical protein
MRRRMRHQLAVSIFLALGACVDDASTTDTTDEPIVVTTQPVNETISATALPLGTHGQIANAPIGSHSRAAGPGV